MSNAGCVYNTKSDALRDEVLPALYESGEAPDEYDLDVIFDACFAWHDHIDSGVTRLDKSDFVQTATENESWAAVAKAAK